MKDHTLRGCSGHRTKPKAVGRSAQSTLRRKQPYPTKQPYPSTYSSHRQRKYTTRTTLSTLRPLDDQPRLLPRRRL